MKGKRELFKGLWIDSSDHDFKKYPVVRLTMTGTAKNQNAVESNIINELYRVAGRNSIDPNSLNVRVDSSPGDILKALVDTLSLVTGETVALLIDEYDAPIHHTLNKKNKAKKILEVLQEFYSAVKTLYNEGSLCLVFVTGVTKLVQGGGFSGFNNYEDLTLQPEYNAICGFTPDEFLKYFEEYLPDLLDHFKFKKRVPADANLEYLMNEIMNYYDGYSWDGENRVLNPFSILKMLRSKNLKPYWFESATPSFLLEVLKHHEGVLNFPENAEMPASDLNKVTIKNLKLNPLLFSAGYLTIETITEEDTFILKRPNIEVDKALNTDLLDCLLNSDKHPMRKLKGRIRKALENRDAASLAECFHDILLWNSYQELKASEGNSHALIFSVLKALEFDVDQEQTESEGRSDLFIALEKRVAYVIEIKHAHFPENVNKLTAEEKLEWEEKTSAKLIAQAKEQIAHKRYGDKHLRTYGVVMRTAMAIVGKTHVAIEFCDPVA
jgi:hypothetical protein